MDAGIYKKHNVKSAVLGMVLLAFVLQHSFVSPVHADRENDEALARKFAPILVLTENPTERGSRYKVINPEPVEIVGANSVSNVQVRAVDIGKNPYYSGPITSSPSLIQEFFRGRGVDFSSNKFAFLTGYEPQRFGPLLPGGVFAPSHILRTYFDYPGNDADSWYAAYFPKQGRDATHAGWKFPNTAYARVFERDSSDNYGSVVIKYYFFYPFNDFENNHEGDWPRVNVMVTSRNATEAKIHGVDYTFHGKGITYYNITDNPSATNNIRKSIAPVGDQYPVVYVSAGGHGNFPTSGHYENGAQGVDEDLTPYGLVLHPEIADSGRNKDIAQSYDIVLLPEPVETLDNMGLAPEMSWLGANVSWGTPKVSSWTTLNLGDSNEAPQGPFYSGWDKIRYDNSDREDYPKSDIPYAAFHNFPIVGDVRWRGTISLLGDVVVFPGATLTIESGTIIEVAAGVDSHKFPAGVENQVELFVYGTLNSVGTLASPIRFQKDSNPGYLGVNTWGGIRMMAGSSEEVRATQILNVPPPSIRPTNLTATVGDGAVTLRWDEPSLSDPSITGWEYHTKLEGAEDWGPWTAVSGRATRQVKVSPLAYGVRHQFEVRAVNANTIGGGPASETVSASLLEVAFSAANYTLIESGNPVGLQDVIAQAEDPTQTRKRVRVGVALTPVPDRRVTIPITVTAGSAESADYEVRSLDEGELSWASSDESPSEMSGRIEEFIIAANPDSDFDDETIQVGFGTPLPVGVRVGSPASATVTLYDTPSAPTGLVAEGGNKQVTLRWDDPGNRGITGWQYQQRRTGDGSLWSGWINMSLSDARTTEYMVTGLSNGVNYRFKVRAFNTRGRGDESSSVAARPSSFIAEAAPSAVRLRWDDPGEAAVDRWEYQVRRVPDKWGPWTPIAGSDATTTEHTVMDLDSGVLYRFKVRAVTASGAEVLTLSAVEATPQAPPCSLTGPPTPTFAENATGAVGTYTASVGCGSALSWVLGGADASFFQLTGEGLSQALEFKRPPNFEQPADNGENNTYAVTVSIGDGSVSVSVSVSVTDANDPGGIALSTTTPEAEQPLTATLSDEDGIEEPVYWTPHYQSASDAGGVTGQASEATQTWTLTIPRARIGQHLHIQADYTDSFGTASATSALVGPVRAQPNRAPTLEGPTSVEVAENSPAPWLLGTYTARDEDGDELTWSVTGTDADAFDELKVPASPGTHPSRTLHLVSTPDYEAQDSYQVWVKVADAALSDSLRVSVSVTNAEEEGAVVLTGGLPPEVGRAVVAELTDPDGQITGASWQWERQASATGAWEALGSGEAGEAGAEGVSGAAEAYSELSSYRPVSGDVGWQLRATARYYDEQDRDTKRSAASAASAAVTGPPSAPQEFTATPGAGQVALRWKPPLSDGGRPIKGYKVRYYPADQPRSERAGFSAVAGGASARDTTIAALTNGTSYVFRVVAHNEVGNGERAEQEATPQAPCQLTGETAPTFAENATGAVGTYTLSGNCGSNPSWTLGGVDAAAFVLKGEGMSRTLEFGERPPNFEQPADDGENNTYAVKVSIGDGSVSISVLVSVTDANDPGGIALSTTTPEAEQTITATLSDEDGIEEPVYWTPHYQSASDAGGVTGQASEATQTWTLTIPRARIGQHLRIQANYTDTFGAASATSALTEAVRAPPNRAPTLEGPTAASIAENSPMSKSLGTYTARDPDGDDLTWSWTGTDADAFELKEPTPQGTHPSRTLHLARAPNYEAKNKYTVWVKVADAALSDSIMVSVSVTDVNEAPTFTRKGPKSVSIAENSTRSLGTYAAHDEDGDAISWNVTSLGLDSFSFKLEEGVGSTRTNPVRELHFRNAPNYEAKSRYQITVQAVSREHLLVRQAVTVEVTNEEEEGSVTLAPDPPQVGKKLIATLKDDDGRIVVDRWSWERFPEPFGATGASGLATGEYTPVAGEVGQYVRVTVYYSDGHGENKQAQSAQTAAIVDVPGTPLDFTAGASDGQVSLSWKAPLSDGGSAITDYKYRHKAAGGSYSKWTTTSTKSATVSSLTNGTEYTFEVRAVNKYGDGRVATATVTLPKPVCSPSSFTATAGDQQVVLAWNAPSGSNCATVTGYSYRYKKSGGSWSDWSDPSTATTQTVSDLTNGQSYTFEVHTVAGQRTSSAVSKSATPQAENQAPDVTGPRSVSIAENKTGSLLLGTYTGRDPDGDELTWSRTGTDADAFELKTPTPQGTNPSRTLHLVSAPNYEAKNSYTVWVKVADAALSDSIMVSVSVINKDDSGSVSLSTTTPQVGKKLIATLKDDDGQIVVDRWSWERFPEPFDATGASGLATGEYTPGAGEVGQYVRVTVYV